MCSALERSPKMRCSRSSHSQISGGASSLRDSLMEVGDQKLDRCSSGEREKAGEGRVVGPVSATSRWPESNMAPSEKKILIVAGPNGAGKTTFAREYLPREAGCPIFVNADLIAEGLSPFDPTRTALRAGRLMLQLMAEYVERGDSFAFETTLAGRNYARSIPGGASGSKPTAVARTRRARGPARRSRASRSRRRSAPAKTPSLDGTRSSRYSPAT